MLFIVFIYKELNKTIYLKNQIFDQINKIFKFKTIVKKIYIYHGN